MADTIFQIKSLNDLNNMVATEARDAFYTPTRIFIT